MTSVAEIHIPLAEPTGHPGPAHRNEPVPAPGPGAVAVLTVAPDALRAAGGPAEWAAAHRETVGRAVAEHGAVLVRGLGLGSAAQVAAAAAALGVAPMREQERFAARRTHAEGVYGSSEWPPDEPMCMHHEVSYCADVPSRAVFGCLTAPRTGGATAVADSGEVLRALPDALVAPFVRHGWQLTRTYREVGVAWTEAFGTDDPERIAKYCAEAAVDHEWLPDSALRTRQRRAAVLRHPVSGERIWFNQIAFLNELTLDPVIREYLTDVYGPDSLPFTTAYGDGTPVPAEVIAAIDHAYRQATRREPWLAGDLMVVDNLRMAHSREAYEGERDVVVILGGPVRPAGHVLP
ncbi:TauD/TfdA family dioxygenase [Streptomyces sp. NPDC059398]|uniref:TauD/TfdA family dioxygenase n=1 Tax=Streptomyces sp. NPDC059398 TaxID=3346820 RepID=UPI0036A88DC1